VHVLETVCEKGGKRKDSRIKNKVIEKFSDGKGLTEEGSKQGSHFKNQNELRRREGFQKDLLPKGG